MPSGVSSSRGKRAAPSEGPADHHAKLLAWRTGSPPLAELEEQFAALQGAGRAAAPGADGVLWRFPALEPPVDLAAHAQPETPQPRPDDVAAQEARLAAHREAAARRAARPLGGTPSGRTDHDEGAPRSRDATRDRAEAMALGTALHLGLERLDFASPPAGWRAALEPVLFAAARGEPARKRATAQLDAFLSSSLPERLHALADHVVGREVPVLLQPDPAEDEAVGFLAGSIDLLYREPGSGAWVVADYKSDQVVAGAALAERAALYAGQGRAYAQAVQGALALPAPPRIELWFLTAGEVVTVAQGDADHPQLELFPR